MKKILISAILFTNIALAELPQTEAGKGFQVSCKSLALLDKNIANKVDESKIDNYCNCNALKFEVFVKENPNEPLFNSDGNYTDLFSKGLTQISNECLYHIFI